LSSTRVVSLILWALEILFKSTRSRVLFENATPKQAIMEFDEEFILGHHL
jgi:hypothetical protein